ncbi:MAG: HEAT repeat domain-containing protein [Anaerolineae bacterium]|nr:HEAT repeat domain-containing protein [Anaerolineae bacterium]
MTSVFISYSRQDGNSAALLLASELQNRGVGVWHDARDIDPSQDFTALIEQAIQNADYIAVCITPDVNRQNSFVRREIQYALLCDKPVIVARFADVLPPISVITHTRIDFFENETDALKQLFDYVRAEMVPIEPALPTPSDPFHPYLVRLYDTIVEFFENTLLLPPNPIELSSRIMPGAVITKQQPSPDPLSRLFLAHGFRKKTSQPIQFKQFTDACRAFDKRLLLLGEPGAGKTVTLMAYMRDAVTARLADSTAPVPLFHLVALWDAQRQPSILEWIAESYHDLNEAMLQAEFEAGNVLLLLDGLDELGRDIEESRQHKARYEPCRQFIDTLMNVVNETNPANRIILTCREYDYAMMNKQLELNGAVTLNKLTTNQIRNYLRDMPDLWAVLEANDDVREVVRTPLLLSVFVEAYREHATEAAQLQHLNTYQELRDHIFATYINRQYERGKNSEETAPDIQKFELNKLLAILGHVAMENVGADLAYENILTRRDFELDEVETIQLPKEDIDTFINLAVQLHLIRDRNSDTYQFVHLMLRDYFAYSYAVEHVNNPKAYPRQDATASHDFRNNPADALGNLGDPRAIGPLHKALRIKRANVTKATIALIRSSAAEALANIGDPAVPSLIEALNDQENEDEIRYHAAKALERLSHPASIQALIHATCHDTNEYVRYYAVQALSQIDDPRILTSLIDVLDDPNEWVRRAVAEALGRLGDPEAIQPLIKALHDSNATIQRMAANALRRFGEAVVEPLIAELHDENVNVRRYAVQILGESQDVRAIKPLIAALNDPEAAIRRYAARGLGIIGDKRAVPALIAALFANDWQVSSRVANALEQIGTPKALEAAHKWRTESRD